MFDLVRQIVVHFWGTAAEMSPYLLFGFLVAGLLSLLVSRRMVERHLGGRGVWPLLKATLFGIPLPLCSCGVIPVSMSLHKHGASKGATVSFLLSTPQTGVDSILVTYSLLGPLFAIFRPLVALVTGMVGGVLVNLFGQGSEDRGPKTDDEGQRNPPSVTSDAQVQVQAQAAEPADEGPAAILSWRQRLRDAMKYSFVTLPRDIGKPLLAGLAVAAAISAIVPDDFFAERLGRGLPAMLLMMAVGIPIYVCASASVPVAAALILKGLSPGAALVFLMTGPATNAAGLATIWNALGRRVAILYLLTVAGCAPAAGIILDLLIDRIDITGMSHAHAMIPPLVQNLSAIVLLALLAYTFLAPKRR